MYLSISICMYVCMYACISIYLSISLPCDLNDLKLYTFVLARPIVRTVMKTCTRTKTNKKM